MALSGGIANLFELLSGRRSTPLRMENEPVVLRDILRMAKDLADWIETRGAKGDRYLLNGCGVEVSAPGLSLRGFEFRNCGFQNCVLPYGDFTGCRFEDCWFGDCTFASASFVGVSLAGCRFENCELPDAVFVGAMFGPEDYSYDAVRTDGNVSFSDCTMDGACFRNVSVTDIVLAGSSCRKQDWRGANLRFVSFERCVLDGSQFDGASLVSPSFKDTPFTECSLASAVVVESSKRLVPDRSFILSRSDAPGLELHMPLVEGLSAQDGRLDHLFVRGGTYVRNADLRAVSMEGSTLFRGTDIDRSRFENIRASDLPCEGLKLGEDTTFVDPPDALKTVLHDLGRETPEGPER